MGSRLGKLNLETKLGISKRRKEACIAKDSGARADWWARKSEIQEVSYCWRPGKGPLGAKGNLTMWWRCRTTVWRMDPKRSREQGKLRSYCNWKGGGRWEGMGGHRKRHVWTLLEEEVSTGPPIGDPGLLSKAKRLRILAQLFSNSNTRHCMSAHMRAAKGWRCEWMVTAGTPQASEVIN